MKKVGKKLLGKAPTCRNPMLAVLSMSQFRGSRMQKLKGRASYTRKGRIQGWCAPSDSVHMFVHMSVHMHIISSSLLASLLLSGMLSLR